MKRTNHHSEWTDRLSDFLDGDLDPARHAEVEAHLAECGSCRRVLEELREVTTQAGALGPVEPSRDLWGGIAATIDAPAPRDFGARVIELPTAERGRSEMEEALASRRFSLTSGQLAAAAVALIAASSLVTWAARPGPEPGVEGSVVATGEIAPVSQVAPPAPDLARELASLERTVLEARGVLDANTLRVLERNLAIIDQAIDDSMRALSQDPENDFLTEHLERVRHRKLEYLRDAARVVEQAD